MALSVGSRVGRSVEVFVAVGLTLIVAEGLGVGDDIGVGGASVAVSRDTEVAVASSATGAIVGEAASGVKAGVQLERNINPTANK